MKVLLTGSGGMVGRNILERARESGHAFLAPRSSELNLLEERQVEAYLHAHTPDLIIHCAGTVGGIQANVREPLRFFDENMMMGRNVVLAAQRASVPRLLNLGSSCMYPRGQSDALKESQILTGELEPTNEGYALAKIAVQRLCAYVSAANPSLKYKTLVPCNLYGRYDKFAPEHSHLVPGVIGRLLEAKHSGARAISMWGDGEARREFMYAGDLADAILRALTHFDSLPALMNIGLGHDYSINDYYRTIARVVGFEGSFEHDLSKPVGMRRKLCDVSLQRSWGWEAKTSLEEGIRHTVLFYKENIFK